MEIGIHEIIFRNYFFLEHNFDIKENRIFFEGVNFLKINKGMEKKYTSLVPEGKFIGSNDVLFKKRRIFSRM